MHFKKKMFFVVVHSFIHSTNINGALRGAGPAARSHGRPQKLPVPLEGSLGKRWRLREETIRRLPHILVWHSDLRLKFPTCPETEGHLVLHTVGACTQWDSADLPVDKSPSSSSPF